MIGLLWQCCYCFTCGDPFEDTDLVCVMEIDGQGFCPFHTDCVPQPVPLMDRTGYLTTELIADYPVRFG